MKTTESTETHDLTVLQIGRLVGEFNARRRTFTEELAALFSAAEAGQPEPPPVTQRAEAVRGRALEMLNGYSPDNLKLPAPVSRKVQLEIDVDACDRVLEILSTKELVARAEEGAEFLLKHGDEWREICRDEILGAVRAGARQAKAAAFRQRLGGVVPPTLQLARYVGHGRPLGDQLSRAIAEALELKIITQKEIKAAQDE